MAAIKGQPTWPPPPELVKAYDIEIKKVKGENSVKGGAKSARFDEKSIGEASQSTISDTTIFAAEEAAIRAEVHEIMQKKFSVGRATLGSNPSSHSEDSVKSGAAIPSVSVIELVTEPMQPSEKTPPSVNPGSPVSVASTPSHAENGGSAPGFSHLTHATTAASPPQIFSTMHWKPKEPPCVFGRSTEDVHTWTSLVRHYLSFMGGSDVQQVAYVVTLLCESAHEWYIGYERRHWHSPKDWAQLCDLLLEHFGWNIRSQEAQST